MKRSSIPTDRLVAERTGNGKRELSSLLFSVRGHMRAHIAGHTDHRDITRNSQKGVLSKAMGINR